MCQSTCVLALSATFSHLNSLQRTILKNYISQAPLPTGFQVQPIGDASGKLEGKEEGKGNCLLPAVPPAEAGALCLRALVTLGAPAVSGRANSSSICRRADPHVPTGCQHHKTAMGLYWGCGP